MNYTPKTFAKASFRIVWLLPYLARVDKRWNDIPPTEVKTTKPRTLVNRISIHISNLKKNYKAVQKLLDELPQLSEPTSELDKKDQNGDTLSDKSEHDEEDQKDGSIYSQPEKVKEEKEAVEVQLAEAPPSCLTKVTKSAFDEGPTPKKANELKDQNS